MNRVPFVFSAIALAVVAGCATEDRVTPAPAPVAVTPAQPSPAATLVVPPAPVPLRAGLGHIESILAVPSAAAGGTASSLMRRMVIRMDDGSLQYFDTEAEGVTVGDPVEITKDGTMLHPV